MRITILTLLFLSALTATAQELVDAPAPVRTQPLTRTDRAIWSGIAVTHVVDYRFTETCISKPYTQCHEGVLPGFIWKHPAAFIATEASFSVGQIVISQELRKHHHKTLARAWDLTNLGAFTGMDFYVHKLCEPSKQTPNPLHRLR
jgi:hypothetical protein